VINQANICTRVIFESCSITLEIFILAGPIEIPLTQRSFPIRSLNGIFQDVCIDQFDCQLCLKWEDLIMTETSAHGCETLALTCGVVSQSYSLGCFDDDNVVPACFAPCLHDCNGHGNCDKGTCKCYPNYINEDCSVLILPCPNQCNSKGSCNNGVCSCNDGWSGADCSVSVSLNSKSSSNFNAAYIIVPLVLIVAIAAIGVGIWYIRKKRDNTPRFSKFDLMEEENDTSLPTLGEDLDEK